MPNKTDCPFQNQICTRMCKAWLDKAILPGTSDCKIIDALQCIAVSLYIVSGRTDKLKDSS